jgi:hypothetical protein
VDRLTWRTILLVSAAIAVVYTYPPYLLGWMTPEVACIAAGYAFGSAGTALVVIDLLDEWWN